MRMKIVAAQSGYILVLTLMIITLVIAITTQIFNEGTMNGYFSHMVIDRERAKQLALGGVQMAFSQIDAKTTTTVQENGRGAEDVQKKLLERLLPTINRWQRFELNESRDGIDGVVEICISCEDGKFNINRMYDFVQKKFVGEGMPRGDMKKIMEMVCKRIEEATGQKELLQGVEKFLHDRAAPLHDVSELFHVREFAFFKNAVFYQPPEAQKAEDKKRPIYLMDIFTVDSQSVLLEPWLFSDSVLALLGLERASAAGVAQRTEMVSNWVKEFKPKQVWATSWDTVLKPLYAKDFTSLPKDIDSMLATQFAPKVFSVLSRARVGEVTVSFYAIILRSEQGAQQGLQKKEPELCTIKRIYWL